MDHFHIKLTGSLHNFITTIENVAAMILIIKNFFPVFFPYIAKIIVVVMELQLRYCVSTIALLFKGFDIFGFFPYQEELNTTKLQYISKPQLFVVLSKKYVLNCASNDNVFHSYFP